jgi:hypothetical protein
MRNEVAHERVLLGGGEAVIVTESWSWTVSEEDDSTVPALVEWDSDEPLVIRIIFDSNGHMIPWMFARELLEAALRHGTAGVGDVSIKVDKSALYLTLDSPFGTITLRSGASHFAGFLRSTYAVVPETAEDLTLAVDVALEKILGRPG